MENDKEAQKDYDWSDLRSEYVDDDGYVAGVDVRDFEPEDIESQIDYMWRKHPSQNPFFKNHGGKESLETLDNLEKPHLHQHKWTTKDYPYALPYLPQSKDMPYISKKARDDFFNDWLNRQYDKKDSIAHKKAEKRNMDAALNAADKRPFHRKGSLNRAFEN